MYFEFTDESWLSKLNGTTYKIIISFEYSFQRNKDCSLNLQTFYHESLIKYISYTCIFTAIETCDQRPPKGETEYGL